MTEIRCSISRPISDPIIKRDLYPRTYFDSFDSYRFNRFAYNENFPITSPTIPITNSHSSLLHLPLHHPKITRSPLFFSPNCSSLEVHQAQRPLQPARSDFYRGRRFPEQFLTSGRQKPGAGKNY